MKGRVELMSQYDKTNRAAALKYSQDAAHSAPVVVASGLGYVAQKIISVAQDNSIPVYQDDSLASLLTQLNVGSEIPPELYQTIVDIYIYFLHYQMKDQEPPPPENTDEEFSQIGFTETSLNPNREKNN
jgi:flagellar biosynthesis protein